MGRDPEPSSADEANRKSGSPLAGSSASAQHPADRHPYNEEMSGELTVPVPSAPASRTAVRDNDFSDRAMRKREEEAILQTKSAGRAAGWAALVLALASWFVWPILLGAAAAAVGFVAFMQGARGLGIWAMTLGLIAVVSYLVLIPIYSMIV